jgi:hypothetical protein
LTEKSNSGKNKIKTKYNEEAISIKADCEILVRALTGNKSFISAKIE